MNVVSCRGSTASALYRVFVFPFEHPQLSRTLPSRSFSQLFIRAPLQQTKKPWNRHAGASLIQQQRGFSVLGSRLAADKDGAKATALPQDHAIPDKYIIVVDETGKASGPHLTANVLRDIDLSVATLRMVRVANPAHDPPEAVCKIVDRKAEREAEKVRKAQEKLDKASKKKGVGKTKELELNWAIDGHDLTYKLKNLKEFLWKGYKVDLTLNSRKRKRAATDEEGKALLKAIEAAIVDVPGTKHRKKTDGEMLQTFRFYLEGPADGPLPRKAE